jgi:hypothetical protein
VYALGLAIALLLVACSSNSAPKPSAVPFSPIPSVPILAGASLSVPNQTFRVGYYLNLSGKGWNVKNTTKVDLKQGGKTTALGVVVVKADGTFNTQVPLPKTLMVGTSLLVVCSYNPGSLVALGCLSQTVSLSG